MGVRYGGRGDREAEILSTDGAEQVDGEGVSASTRVIGSKGACTYGGSGRLYVRGAC